MLESIMLIALGFLTATLFALIAIQFVWRRAVKVTTQKLTSEVDLDELKANADQAASLNISLRDKSNEIAGLSSKNAQLEESLAAARQEYETSLTNTRQEIDTLTRNITDLQTEHTALKTEAETRLRDLTALRSHVGEIEAALRIDFEKRGLMENQLKALGAKTLQLLEEMNRAVTDFGDTTHIQSLLEATPAPATTAEPEKSEAPAKLTPLVLDETDESESTDTTELEEIKASLDQGVASKGAASTKADSGAPAEDETGSSSASSESYIADRIRALEAGVNTSA